MNKKIRKTLKYIFEFYVGTPALTDSINNLDDWGIIISETLEWHKDDYRLRVIEEKYLWKKNEVQICLQLSIASSTLYAWENEILETAMNFAIARKLIIFDYANREYCVLFSL